LSDTLLLFLANALLCIAIATPLTLPRAVMGVAAVIALNVLRFPSSPKTTDQDRQIG